MKIANRNHFRIRMRRGNLNQSNHIELRNRFPNNIERNAENDRIQNRSFNNEIANEINRLRDLLRNNNNQLNNITITNASVNGYMDKSFIKIKTRNIIIENKQEYPIETNIKNIITKKDNKNAINLEEINIQILNCKNELINNS